MNWVWSNSKITKCKQPLKLVTKNQNSLMSTMSQIGKVYSVYGEKKSYERDERYKQKIPELVKKFKVQYSIEISALTGLNIDQLLDAIVKLIEERKSGSCTASWGRIARRAAAHSKCF